MKRSLFLLGGGLMQLPAITAAHELGLIVHMADGNNHCLGRDRADHFHHVDLRDIPGLISVARSIPDLAGVFTAGTDFSGSVAAVAADRNLPGTSVESARNATDKGRMRAVLSAAGVSVPLFVVFPGHTGAIPFSPPWVVKPVDNMGARGVTLISETEDLDRVLSASIASARALSVTGQAVVEQFISGQEYSLDALVFDGTVKITGIGERHIFFKPNFVELGHTMPAAMPQPDREALSGEFTRAIRALGIERGAAKGDLFLDHAPDGTPIVTIGEVAARLSGGFMSGWTFPGSTGIALTRLGISVALGENPDEAAFTPALQKVSVERALISAPGVVATITVPENLPAGAHLFIHSGSGDTVRSPVNNVEKVANAIVSTDSRIAAERVALDILDGVVVRLKPGYPESDTFVFTEGWRSRYSRYRITTPEGIHFLAAPVNGSGSRLPQTGGADNDGPLLIQDLRHLGLHPEQLKNNQISITAAELLERLEGEGSITYSSVADPVLTVFFYRAFLAAGRQGVLYLRDSLRKETTE